MADRRYVTLSPLRWGGNKFPTGTPVALPEAEGVKLVAAGAVADQAGALPAMPPGPPEIVYARRSDQWVAKFSHPLMNPLSLVILGQSNEVGQVPNSDRASYPQAFASLRNPAVTSPLPGNVSLNSFPPYPSGGLWFSLYDALYDAGWNTRITLGAIGSASLIAHYCGQVKTRANSTVYYQRRAPEGPGDYGYVGDIVLMSGKLFRCTSGAKLYARWPGPDRPVGTSQTNIDFIVSVGSSASAGAAPDFSGATLGSTVTDGAITWTCIDATNSVGYTSGQIFNEKQRGLGFDPLGLLQDAFSRANGTPCFAKAVVVQNAQADASASSGQYQLAHQAICDYWTHRGYTVFSGLSFGTPTISTANYDTLTAGLNAAIANRQADAVYGSQSKAGANLYSLLGSVAGQNGLAFQGDNVHVTGGTAIIGGRLVAQPIIAWLNSLTEI